MDFRAFIETSFEGKAFEQPLFYAYEGGLRFELSEGGTPINQVFIAMKKAEEICRAIFDGEETVGVCLRHHGSEEWIAAKSQFRELKRAEVEVPRKRQIWIVPGAVDGEGTRQSDQCWHHLAFLAPKSLLTTLLWCSFVGDFGVLAPRPGFHVYLFSVKRKLLIWPYDDRGMDVVGPNHQALKMLYFQFKHYLLDYDREIMAAAFER